MLDHINQTLHVFNEHSNRQRKFSEYIISYEMLMIGLRYSITRCIAHYGGL